jgi:lipoprotein-anchoring transpeptidase ErfK/SrfK
MPRRLRFGGDVALVALGSVALVLVLARVTPWSENGGAQAGALEGPAALAVEHRGTQYQELVELTAPHQVYVSPAQHPFQRIDATRPITAERTVLPVLRSAVRRGAQWLDVRLPGRPNGLTGWIKQDGTKLEFTRWHIVVKTKLRRVDVYDAGHLVRSFIAVVGAPATPTPVGQFFVEENVALAPTAVGYPYALALSSRSNVLQEFDGGPGQIALHGLDNVGGTPGTAVSHGCIRLGTGEISWLAHHIDPGVPVTVS